MNMTIHNLKVAVRNLLKYKLQVAMSVLSIAIGIVTLALVHAFVTWFKFPSICSQPYYERTYSLELEPKDAQNSTVTAPLGRDIPNRIAFSPDIIRALKRDGGMKTAECVTLPNIICYGDIMEFQLCDSTWRKFETTISPVDPEYIPFIGLRSAITGQPIKRLQPGETIISKLKASYIFGEANPVGAVSFDVCDLHPMPLTIVDVFENVPLTEQVISNDIILFSSGEREDVLPAQNNGLYPRHAKIVLREGFTEKQLTAELNERLAPFNTAIKLRKESDNIQLSTIISIQVFGHLAGALILLAAIIGFLRMQIQLFWMRRRELSLRMVNGAKRGQLFWLLMTEVFLVVGLSVTVAMMMGIWTEDFLYTRFADLANNAEFSIHGFARYGLYIGGVLLLICGLVIWLTLIRICNAGQGLAANMRNSRTHLFRNVMLGLQIAICILFVCSTLTVSNWSNIMMKRFHLPDDLTPYKESILLNMDAATSGSEALKREIEHLPSLKKMMAHYNPYIGIRELMDGDENVKAEFHDNTYMPIFHASDTALIEFLQCKVNWFNKPIDKSKCLILNEGFYKRLRKVHIADNDMLTIQSFPDCTLPIAGTVPDLPYSNMKDCFMILPNVENGCGEFVLIPMEGKYRELMHEVDSVVRSMEPSVVKKMAQNFHESHSEVMMIDTMRQTGWLLAAVSIVICAMSIYSTIALDTRSRKKEVAIRKVNGAKSGDIYRLFGRLYFILVGIALVVALPVFLMFHKIFAREFFRGIANAPAQGISPIGLFVAGSLIVIAMIAAIVIWNIRGIMRTDPSEIIAKE